MKRFSDLPIYFIITGLILNLVLSLKAKVSFTELMIRSIIVIILFTVMGLVLANVLSSASQNIKKSSRMKADVKKEATTTSTFDVKVESHDEDELLRAISRSRDDDDEFLGAISQPGDEEDEPFGDLSQSKDDDFVEINPGNFKKFMDQD
jgi:hypothetical protein